MLTSKLEVKISCNTKYYLEGPIKLHMIKSFQFRNIASFAVSIISKNKDMIFTFQGKKFWNSANNTIVYKTYTIFSKCL